MTASSLLSVDKLSKHFGGVVATENVSLTVPAGSMHCIIGPNGAGKSTFFALLTGIQAPDSGQIIFKGDDITTLSCLLFASRRESGSHFRPIASFMS